MDLFTIFTEYSFIHAWTMGTFTFLDIIIRCTIYGYLFSIGFSPTSSSFINTNLFVINKQFPFFVVLHIDEIEINQGINKRKSSILLSPRFYISSKKKEADEIKRNCIGKHNDAMYHIVHCFFCYLFNVWCQNIRVSDSSFFFYIIYQVVSIFYQSNFRSSSPHHYTIRLVFTLTDRVFFTRR